MGKSTINIYKWPFSVVLLVYQRVFYDIFLAGDGSFSGRQIALSHPFFG
jgi:hypothetical protein